MHLETLRGTFAAWRIGLGRILRARLLPAVRDCCNESQSPERTEGQGKEGANFKQLLQHSGAGEIPVRESKDRDVFSVDAVCDHGDDGVSTAAAAEYVGVCVEDGWELIAVAAEGGEEEGDMGVGVQRRGEVEDVAESGTGLKDDGVGSGARPPGDSCMFRHENSEVNANVSATDYNLALSVGEAGRGHDHMVGEVEDGDNDAGEEGEAKAGGGAVNEGPLRPSAFFVSSRMCSDPPPAKSSSNKSKTSKN